MRLFTIMGLSGLFHLSELNPKKPDPQAPLLQPSLRNAVQGTREMVHFLPREPTAFSPQYRQADHFGMGSTYGGTEFSTRQGRQDLDNVTSRDSKRPKERARDRE